MIEGPAPITLGRLGLRILRDISLLLSLSFAAVPAAMAVGMPPARLQPANAWALLVGVSEYPQLAVERQLRGPSHDVGAMRDALQGLHDWRSITVLADHVENAEGLPSRKSIVAAFHRLAQQVGRNDFVVVYFSGHGSQQPAAAGDSGEPDGLDEIFLPRDVGKWDGAAGTVRNAITDNELNALLGPLLQQGANVWAIFDTCHSGTVTRGAHAPNETVRSVNPSELGVPIPGMTHDPRGSMHAGVSAPATAGELIVFSAAQSAETTPELRLPPGDRRRVQRGLFTYAVLQALAAMGPSTYQELAQYVVARYASMNRASPTPLFEGALGRSIPLGEARQRALGLSLQVFSAPGPDPCGRLDASAMNRSLGQARPLQNFRAGDSLCAVLDNRGRQPVDVTLLHVAADRAAQPLFPLRGESNRIAAGEQRRIALEVVAEGEASLDTMVALAVPARSGSERVQLPWPAHAESAAAESSRDVTLTPAPGWMQAVRWISLPKQADAR